MIWQKGKIVALFLAFASTALLASCGGADSETTSFSQTEGPSQPSGYYINLSASPYAVSTGGSIAFRAHVWDSTGKNVVGATVEFSGDTSDSVTTDSSGYASTTYGTSGEAGAVGSVTVSIENKSVSIAYTIVP